MYTSILVIHHKNAVLTVAEACRTAGIPRSSASYINEDNQKGIAEFQGIIFASNCEQL